MQTSNPSSLPIFSASPSGAQALGWQTLIAGVAGLVASWAGYAAWAVSVRALALALGWSPVFSGTLSRLGGIILMVGLFALLTRRILGERLSELAFPRGPGWWADLLFGAGLAALAMLVLFLIYRAGGWLTVTGWKWQELATPAWLGVVWGSLLSCAQAALTEEVIFRGFLLTGLRRAWGRAGGLAIMALAFAMLHLPVSTAAQTPWPVFLLALCGPGLLLGWAALRSGSLWLPIGVHFTWNLVQGELFNLSGNNLNPHVFGAVTHLHGPAWLVGTSYGVEVGLFGLLALAIVGAGCWWWTTLRRLTAAQAAETAS